MSEIDRRAARSRRMLWEALLALLQDRDWGEINVQMICDRADVARSTFYAHFPTKQDLLDSGFALGATEIAAQIANRAPEGRLHTLEWLVDHVGEAQGFQRRVQGTPAGQAIMARFRAMTADLLRADLERFGTPISAEDLAFLTGGIFAVIEAWVAQGCREPKPALILRLTLRIDAVLGRLQ